MKKKTWGVLGASLLVAAGLLLSQQKPTLSEASVVRVLDGDTIEVQLDGQKERIRFLLVDTPEVAHFGKPAQPYAKLAKDYTQEQIAKAGNKVQLEFDQTERDKYGRRLAHVYVNGRSLQVLLLRNGYARYAYDYEDYKHEAEYHKAEETAKAKHLNIWKVDGYVQKDGYHPEVMH